MLYRSRHRLVPLLHRRQRSSVRGPVLLPPWYLNRPLLQDLFGAMTLPDALLQVLLFIQSIQFDGSEVIARHHALDPVVLDYG